MVDFCCLQLRILTGTFTVISWRGGQSSVLEGHMDGFPLPWSRAIAVREGCSNALRVCACAVPFLDPQLLA